ncbi:hypothetical protein [Nibribacter koreensis]|uniref:PEP-CTERM protein-sorting domain-containing protein n=1 Tax=Nibribacter koreensis TaxID=1084519 RepID=A0ABP8FMC2_9BACT
MNTRNANMLLNGMLVVSFLILMRNIEHPNIMVPALSFVGFLIFVVFKFIITLRNRKQK